MKKTNFVNFLGFRYNDDPDRLLANYAATT